MKGWTSGEAGLRGLDQRKLRLVSRYGFLLVGGLLALALGAEAGDQLGLDLRARGVVGPAFGWLGGFLARLFGWATVVLLPIVPIVHALRGHDDAAERNDRSRMRFLGGMLVLLPLVLGLAVGARVGDEWHPLPGHLGGILAAYAREGTGTAGAWLVALVALGLLSASTLAYDPLHRWSDRLLRALNLRAPAPAPAVGDVASADAEATPARKRRRKSGEAAEDLALALSPTAEELPAIDPTLMDEPEPIEEPALAPEASSRKRKAGRAEQVVARDEAIATAIAATETAGDQAMALPPVELLTAAPPRNSEVSKRELDAAEARLVAALRTFKVEGKPVDRTTGPTVTQFEIEPAAGVKVRQFATLADDLALAMRAPSIRVVAPIPGKGAVGIEVPNASPETVMFRDMVESPDFQKAKAALPIVLGKDLTGKPVVTDLAKMPHLLIAGATGSGKSVCVNTIITSLVYRHTPRTLRFLMVDPKMVELSVYNVLPHLRHKVITDNRDAAAVLKWAVHEMNDRYQLLAENGCRNLVDFNDRVQRHRSGEGPALRLPKAPDVAFEVREYAGDILPYIVVVIDEMADLMMTVQGEVETPIAMLAQKARAIGIHLILATQRPSVNVITGLIKANFPSRIAFRVASQVDSRTILDGAGAEMLLGNGDMLFIPPGRSEPSRIQGAYLPGDDTEKLMRWFEDRTAEKRAGRLAEAVDERLEEEDILEVVKRLTPTDGKDDGDRAEGGARDPLFRDAAELCIQQQGGSTSLLQRRLGIGYGRAARIIDQLADAGVLEPKGGPKGREVLVGITQLDEICGSGP